MERVEVEDGATFGDVLKAVDDPKPREKTSVRRFIASSLGYLARGYAAQWSDTLCGAGVELPDDEPWSVLVKRSRVAGSMRVADVQQACRLIGEALHDQHPLEYWSWWWISCGAESDHYFKAPTYLGRCSSCGRFFFHVHPQRTSCNGCRRKAERDKKRRQRGTDLQVRSCECCGTSFTPKRATAKFCSDRCRARWRRRQAA